MASETSSSRPEPAGPAGLPGPARLDVERRFLRALARGIARAPGGPLFRPGERILVACSAGPDSTALAAGLAALAPARARRWTLVLARFDHLIRDEPARAADRALVEALGARLGAAVEIGEGSARARAARERRGLEDAARRARYAFLERVAREHECARVAVAHHLDDQAETVLLRLLRGAGLRGLGGIPVRRALGPRPGPEVVRPMLAIPRASVHAYLAATCIPSGDDHTNHDPGFALRNRVRLEVAPLLDSLRPGWRRAVTRAAAASREAWQHLASEARSTLGVLGAPGARSADEPANLSLEVAPLDGLTPAVRRAALTIAVERAFARTPTARDLEALVALAGPDARVGQRAHLSGNVHAERTAKAIQIGLPDQRSAPHEGAPREPQSTPIELADATQACARCLPLTPLRLDAASPAEADLACARDDALGVEVACAIGPVARVEAALLAWAAGRPGARLLWLDAARVDPASLSLRAPHLGERIQPRGMHGQKRLSDLFIDAKVPRAERARALVLTVAALDDPPRSPTPSIASVVWPKGARADRRFAAAPPTLLPQEQQAPGTQLDARPVLGIAIAYLAAP